MTWEKIYTGKDNCVGEWVWTKENCVKMSGETGEDDRKRKMAGEINGNNEAPQETVILKNKMMEIKNARENVKEDLGDKR